MNLQSVAASVISAVNPQIPALLRMSTGYATAADGTQVPQYDAPLRLMIQVQALSGGELKQLQSLNIADVNSVAYMNGNWNSLNRPNKQGGDLLTFQGQNWLIVALLENWPDWTKAAIVLQQDQPWPVT